MLLKKVSNIWCSPEVSVSAYRRKVLVWGESWLTIGKVSKWEGNKWESCVTDGKERVGPSGHLAGWRTVSMGVMKAVDKVKTELQFTRSISKRGHSAWIRESGEACMLSLNSISFWDILSYPS